MAYLGLAVAMNALTGANYAYASRPPENPSLLDHLGPWPWYLLSMQGSRSSFSSCSACHSAARRNRFRNPDMPAKRKPDDELRGPRARERRRPGASASRGRTGRPPQRSLPSRTHRALALYDRLDEAQKEQIPQVLRVWLRYRSEKYFGEHRTPPGGAPPSQAERPGRSRITKLEGLTVGQFVASTRSLQRPTGSPGRWPSCTETR